MQPPKRGLAGVRKIMENRQRRCEQWQAEARVLWGRWRGDPLFLLGVGLYWGEGQKCRRSASLALSNADPQLLQVWLRWYQRFLPGVPLYSVLHIHDGGDVRAARLFWERQLGIVVNAVAVAVSSASKRKRRTLPNGTLKVRVGRGGLEWYTKMLVWLDLAQQL